MGPKHKSKAQIVALTPLGAMTAQKHAVSAVEATGSYPWYRYGIFSLPSGTGTGYRTARRTGTDPCNYALNHLQLLLAAPFQGFLLLASIGPSIAVATAASQTASVTPPSAAPRFPERVRDY